MNEQDHAELERLKRRQEELRMQLANLTVDIHRLASRVNESAQPPVEIRPLEIPPLENMPPLFAADPPLGSVRPEVAAVPPPLPPVIVMQAESVPPASCREETQPIQPSPIQPQPETRQDAGGTLLQYPPVPGFFPRWINSIS